MRGLYYSLSHGRHVANPVIGNSVTGQSSSGTTVFTSGMGSALTNPSLIVVSIGLMDGTASGSVSGVTDTAGNTYTKAVSHADGTGIVDQEIWSAQNTHTTSSNVITATVTGQTGGSVANRCYAVEITGMATSSALDVVASGAGTGTNATTGATSTTAEPVEVAVCGIIGYAASSGSGYYNGSGYTTYYRNIDTSGSQYASNTFDALITSSSGTQTATWSHSMSQLGYAACVAVFKSA